MSASDDTPIQTPLPKDCDTSVGKPCPYHGEIELVRAWRSAGLDELMIVSRRRDRWTVVLVGALLAVLLGIGATAIWGGVELASELGRLRGTTSTRLEVVERRVEEDSAELRRLTTSASDTQTTVLVTLGRIQEQLSTIDRRLDQVETARDRRQRR